MSFHIAKALLYNVSLEVLDLAGNEFGDDGGDAIARASVYHKQLRQLNLAHCEFGVKSSRALSRLLSGETMLESLFLDGNPFGQSAAFVLQGVQRCHTLKSLSLTDCGLNDSVALLLADAITQTDTSLESLLLARNGLTDHSGRVIARVIPGSKLRVLNMDENNLGEGFGLEMESALIAPDVVLECLSVNHNKLGNLGGSAICRALKRNHSVRELFIAENNMDDDTMQSLRDMVTNTGEDSYIQVIVVESENNQVIVEDDEGIINSSSSSSSFNLMSKKEESTEGMANSDVIIDV